MPKVSIHPYVFMEAEIEGKKPKIAIIDGTYYIFRAFFGIQQSLTNKDGFPTKAIFTFKNMLATLLKDVRPNYVAVVFDAGKPSFRSEIFPEYKAHRDEAAPDLIQQIPYIFQLVDLLGFTQIVMEDFEADDVIASLALKFCADMDVLIISADKDLTQMIQPGIRMYDTMRGTLFGPDEVLAKFGVHPHQIADYLALVGDKSDNIPGAKGIGQVGAAKLLKEYHNLDTLRANLANIPGKPGELLRASWEIIEMSKKLTLIHSRLPLDFSAQDFDKKATDLDKLKEFYTHFGFKPDFFWQTPNVALPPNTARISSNQHGAGKPIALALAEKPAQDPIDRSQYQLLNTPELLKAYVDKICAQKLGGFDLETTSLNPKHAELVGVAFQAVGEPAAYCPISHKAPEPQVAINLVMAELKRLVENPAITLVGQNLKYEYAVLTAKGLVWRAQMEDTLLESFLVNSESLQHNLDVLAERLLNHKNISFDELTGKGKARITFDLVPIEMAKAYSAEDIDVTWRIHELLRPKVRALGMDELYQNTELPLIPVLASMEGAGIKINLEEFHRYSAELKQEIQGLEKEIHALAGQTFNLNSTQQLGHILFEKMGIEGFKTKTKTGFSTDASVLEKLAKAHPIAAKMLAYRTKNKLVSTYLDALPTLADPETHRLHTSFSQAVAATGRLSSSNPNLQNIPIRGPEGSKMRACFIAEPGHWLLSADYSQIELRVLAHISEDAGLLQSFISDIDIHRTTAAKIFGKSIEEVSSEDRAVAKAINYGIVYGMGPQRLAEELNISMKDASAFIQSYFKEFPGIKTYMQSVVARAKVDGWVETLLHRKRWVPDITSSDRRARGFAERVAMNTPLQGTAADIIKQAMLKVYSRLNREGLKSRLLLQVHDELVLEVPEAERDQAERLVVEEMEHALPLKVALKVSAAFGRDWNAAH